MTGPTTDTRRLGVAPPLPEPARRPAAERSAALGCERVAQALAELAAGRPVLLAAPDGRRADLVAAADATTAEMMAHLVRHSSGFVCVALPEHRADVLDIPPQVADGQNPRGLPFGVTVDAKDRISTGISATDRSRTVRLLASPDAGKADFTRPGHVVPLRTVAGGVLRRPRPAEAAVDLVLLAGRTPAAVLADAVLAQVDEFAAAHRLVVVHVADVAAYRAIREPPIRRAESASVDTPAGPFTATVYLGDGDGPEHVVFVRGEVGGQARPIPVHVVREPAPSDPFGSGRPADPEDQPSLSAALERIRDGGVAIYLRSPARGSRILDLLRHDSVPAAAPAAVCRHILLDLGVRRVELAVAEAQLRGELAAAGVDVCEPTRCGSPAGALRPA